MAETNFPNVEPNILDQYVSYDYIFTFSALTKNEINYPDETYKKGSPVENVIFKSGGGSQSRRPSIETSEGTRKKYEFYIDNFAIDSTFGGAAGATAINSITFTVMEPYSIGLLLSVMQEAATNALRSSGADTAQISYTQAVYLITIEFIGYNSEGVAVLSQDATRYIPVNIREVVCNLSGAGCQYEIAAIAQPETALLDTHNQLFTDVAIHGATVQEMLQSGKDSLQNVVNRYFKDHAEKLGTKVTPDQIAIVFPKNDNARSAITPAESTATLVSDIVKKVGNIVGESLTEDKADLNEIGGSSLKFDMTTPGECKAPGHGEVQEGGKPVSRNRVSVDAASREFRFSQGSTIVNAITQVLLVSEFCAKNAGGPVDSNGMYTWFRINTETHLLDGLESNLRKTGRPPYLMIYRVETYKVHSYKFLGPGSLPKGYANLKNQVIKSYEYLYTGKNVDLLRFDFSIKFGFYQPTYADGGALPKDATQSIKFSAGPNTESRIPQKIGQGVIDSTSGAIQTGSVITTATSGQGGGGGENYTVTRARTMQDVYINDSVDQSTVNITILGDPYYIPQLGVSNSYRRSKQIKFNKADDGSINLISGEVDIHIKFQTPNDIGEDGYADFRGDNPVTFTGIYQVTKLRSQFQQGKFTQELTAIRRGGQNPNSDSLNAAKGRDAIESVANAANNIATTIESFGVTTKALSNAVGAVVKSSDGIGISLDQINELVPPIPNININPFE
jgi:hypothetical protein